MKSIGQERETTTSSLLHEEILTGYFNNKDVAIRQDNILSADIYERKTAPNKEYDEGYKARPNTL